MLILNESKARERARLEAAVAVAKQQSGNASASEKGGAQRGSRLPRRLWPLMTPPCLGV